MAKNRTELVAEVAEKSGKSQATVNAVLDAVFQVFESSVSKGEKITIPGWLAIERTDRAARTGRNPQTGETIQIPAGHGVKLTAGSKLKAAVAKKYLWGCWDGTAPPPGGGGAFFACQGAFRGGAVWDTQKNLRKFIHNT